MRHVASCLTPMGWCQLYFFIHQILLTKYITPGVNHEGQHRFSTAERERCLHGVTSQWAQFHPWKLMALSSVHPRLPSSTQTFIYLFRCWQHQQQPVSLENITEGKVKVTCLSKMLVCLNVCQTPGWLSKRNVTVVHTQPLELCFQSLRVCWVQDSRQHS